MNKHIIGRIINQRKGYKAFIPTDICNIKFKFHPPILSKANEAVHLIGKLDGISRLLPDIEFFLLMYMRKDATSSSNIEGTQATLIDSIEQEANVESAEQEANAESFMPNDVLDITQYIKAMNKGFENLDQLPISNRFIQILHKELMDGGRKTSHANPGNFRTSQNWIGGRNLKEAHFIPPPPLQVGQAMGELERFIHRPDDILPLIKAGIMHAHFETIHPFLDGNGRTGRLLITFFLHQINLLEKPILFLSSYFMENRQTYYDKLNAYHRGDYSEWLLFFLNGVIQIANESISIIDKVVAIRERDMAKIASFSKMATETTLKVYPHLFGLPIVSVATVMEWGNLSRPGAQKVIDRLVEKDILTLRNPNQKYRKSYVYQEYLNVFTEV